MNPISLHHTFSVQDALKWVYNRLLPTLLAGVLMVVVWMAGQHAEPYVHDLFLRWCANSAQHSPVTLILIDDDSLGKLRERFGAPPWPRTAYLEVFQAINATHPALMVFDSHFVRMDQAGDARFFKALKQFPNLISGLAIAEKASGENQLNTQLPAYYQLSLGVVSMREDGDGVIRSLKLFYAFHPPHAGLLKGGNFPALSLAAVSKYLSIQPQVQDGLSGPVRSTGFTKGIQAHSPPPWAFHGDTKSSGGALEIHPENQPGQSLQIPLSPEGTLGLHWERLLNPNQPEAARSHPAIPVWRFFDRTTASPDLSGKIALIGSSSSFYNDYHQTPMANRHLGPDIHATAIDNLLSGQSIRKVEAWRNLSLLIFLALTVFFIRLKYRSISRTLLYTLGSMVIYNWIAFWSLYSQGWQLDVVTPVLFMAVAFMAASSLRISLKEKQLAQMEKNLSQLVDPEVFQEIRRLSHVLVPGGQKLEITSLFVDIRNFTALAEHLQPHELTGMLNEFYGETVNIIFSYHGTVDKFMGDGILIIFGAPLPNQAHRLMAMQAAQDILKATGQLCQRWRETLAIDTEIGISLNSGPAFVGFFGPADQLVYTGVGDTVNICVRLQEHTKHFQTRLIISESTVKGLGETLNDGLLPDSFLPLGEVSVRGREGTLRIFTLPQALIP
jgi:adenylate cyclase